jgi:protein-S-isoprenylcysteine O-methyltransferase Ste14
MQAHDRSQGDGRPPWWRGQRGEWYVVVQLALMALVFFGPASLTRVFVTGGVVLMLAGGALLFASLLRLGAGLTPLPYPRPGATLVVTGPYRLVRHPMYAGGIVLGFGWALFNRGWLTLVFATVILVFFDIKSAREERWLVARFPDYAAYQRRVRKLIPFIH